MVWNLQYVGPQIHALRESVSAALATRKQALEDAALAEQLSRDTLDLTLPHMDGIECVERLVEIKPDVLILVVSALADKATAVEAMEKGLEPQTLEEVEVLERKLTDALADLKRIKASLPAAARAADVKTK